MELYIFALWNCKFLRGRGGLALMKFMFLRGRRGLALLNFAFLWGRRWWALRLGTSRCYGTGCIGLPGFTSFFL